MTKILTKILTAILYSYAAASAAYGAAAYAEPRHQPPVNENATIEECVRAPNVGAFASDPYTVPPCTSRPLDLSTEPMPVPYNGPVPSQGY